MKKLNTSNLYLTFLRKFYRIEGELDEYSLSEINTFGNHMYMLMYSLVFISFLFYFFDIADTVGLIFLILLFLPPHLQKRMAKRLGLDKIETERSELKQARWAMLKRTLLQTSFTALLLGGLFWLTAAHQPPESTFHDIAFGTWAIFVGLRFIYLLIKNFRKIKIID